MRQFVNEFYHHNVHLKTFSITLTLNHLKNNQKKFVETFGQLEKKLYFCTRFR